MTLHPSRGLGKKQWSHNAMKEMLQQAKNTVVLRRLGELSDDDWNELGDWLWYQTHPTDSDSFIDRPKPDKIIKRISGT